MMQGVKMDVINLFYLAESVGLSLSYGLSLNSVLFWAIYMSCFVENRMVSVERIKQFTNIPSEPAWEIKDRVPPSNWPVHGNIDLIDLQVTGLQLTV
jgi:ATP-binding cassette subfamily C (CFTR/MRP) protein 2